MQIYPLQMMTIPDQPFDKITVDLVTDLNISTLGNQHSLTIIDHLTGWQKAFPIVDKKADTIICIFINNYLPVDMFPRYILSDNGMELKNQWMDDVLLQCGINPIFSALYHPQHTRKLEVFNKYLKPTLKNLYENHQGNWDQYIIHILSSDCVSPYLSTGKTPFFLIYGRDSNHPLHQLLEPMQWSLSNLDSTWLNLKLHYLIVAIAKKTLDENRFKNAQKTTDCPAPDFQVKNLNKQRGKWDLKWRGRYRIVCIECDRQNLHIENQATGKTQSCNVKDVVHEPPAELWDIGTQFCRAGMFINHPANLCTITLHNT